MFGDQMIPWIEFEHLEHATERTLVRADSICAVNRGPSGVNIHLIGGGVVAVKGSAAKIRAQIDAFMDAWDEERDRRYRARQEAREAREA